MAYRVVETDNYGSDYPNEKFALPYHFSKDGAKDVADAINKHLCQGRFWKVVEMPYELQPGFEP